MGWQDNSSFTKFREPSSAEEADYAAYQAWAERERAEGREYVPEPWEIEGPAVSISLGDACDLDPALLAAIGAQTVSAQWAQGNAADALRPSPVLAALTRHTVSNAGQLSDDELLGALSAARRLENHAAAQQTVLISEFARRRLAQREEAQARGLPPAWQPGGAPDAELAMELTCSINYASDLIDEAVGLTRLPDTFARLWDGVIDYGRAMIIYRHSRFLTDADAAYADRVLAAAAPHLRHDQLQRKAAALEMKLDPDAVRRRRERAAKDGRRVEVRRERSGNAAIAGRELEVADVLAAKAHIDAVALGLRNAGVPGTLQHLRASVLTALLQGRDPLELIGQPAAREPANPAAAPDADGPDDTANGAGTPAVEFPDDGYIDEDDPDSDDPDSEDGDHDRDRNGDATPRAPGGAAPVRANINLLVPVGNVFGWPAAPALAGGWGLLDAAQTRDLLSAAASHPATRWCWTLLNPDGTAAAHGCAAGHHPWPLPHSPHSPARPDPHDPADPGRSRDGPTPAQAARLGAFLASLGATLRPIARGTCDHDHAEDRYVPSRKLKHLIQARSATCPAPGCDGQAATSDADHTIPWPDGPTDECNLSPPCRRHHRVKQAPGWKLVISSLN